MDKVIAIDGPSGSGKSTITKEIASALGFTYLDTGAMFRALAYKLQSLSLDFSSKLNVEQIDLIRTLLQEMRFEYAPTKDILIRIDGEDLTNKIREHHISKLASEVSQFSVVRSYLLNLQRKIATKSNSILEGRDIGTVVFPKAALKIYLSASSKKRAKRRFLELTERGEKSFNIEEILQDIEKRDFEDMNRVIAPLKKADDAVEIDTTDMTINEVVSRVQDLYKERESLFNT